MSEKMTMQYLRDGAFCPSILRTNIFTMMAKDNCDHNASSNTATQHYHGTSITIMQYPTQQCPGQIIIDSTQQALPKHMSKKVRI